MASADPGTRLPKHRPRLKGYLPLSRIIRGQVIDNQMSVCEQYQRAFGTKGGALQKSVLIYNIILYNTQREGLTELEENERLSITAV